MWSLTSGYLMGRVPLNVMTCPEKLFYLNFSPDSARSLSMRGSFLIKGRVTACGACEEFDNNRRFPNQSLSGNQTCNSRRWFWQHLAAFTCIPSFNSTVSLVWDLKPPHLVLCLLSVPSGHGHLSSGSTLV